MNGCATFCNCGPLDSESIAVSRSRKADTADSLIQRKNWRFGGSQAANQQAPSNLAASSSHGYWLTVRHRTQKSSKPGQR